MDVQGWLEGYCGAAERRSVEGEARLATAALIVRSALWIGLAAVFWWSGLDARLAEGLWAQCWHRGWLPWAYMAHVALAVASYEGLLFPLTYVLAEMRERYRAARGKGAEEGGIGEVLWGFWMSLTVEVGLCTVGLTLVHVLRRLLGPWWWVALVAVFAVMRLDSSSWFRAGRERKAVDDADFLAALKAGLERLGGAAARLDVRGVALDLGECNPVRPVRFVREEGSTGHLAVVAKEWWMALDEEARLMALLREAAHRKARRVLRAVELALAALGCGLGAWLTDAVAVRMGWGTLAAAEAVPVIVIVFFSLATVLGCAIKYIARRVNGWSDVRAARAHAGGADAFAHFMGQLYPLTEAPPRLPRWCTLFLFEYAPLSRALRVEKALAAQ